MKGLNLYRLKKGIELQLKGDYSKSVKYYDLLENDKIRNVNKFSALMLQQSIIEAKICFHNLNKFEKQYEQCKNILLDYFNASNNLDCEKLYEHQGKINSSDVLLSIIIPVYNSSKYLDNCLCSVLKQTYSNLEIIIVNDGSTDNSVSIIKKYADIDRRIVFIDNALPSGNPGTPRNQALKIAKGNYVTFVDSDDYIAADYYENFLNSLHSNKEEVDIVLASGYQDYYNKDKVIKRIYNNSNFDDKLDIFYRYHESFTIWDKIYRTSFLINNDIYLAETPAAVDVPFVFKCYIAAKKISICSSNYGYFYRRESDSSVTVNKRMKSNCQFEFDVYDQVMNWVSLSPSRTSFSPLVDFKKISSYLYTLSLISDEYKEGFYKKVRSEFLSFDKDLMIELLSRSKQHSKLGRFKKILAVPYIE
jgi:glycosyltransferase involved in cell wall biosynthesis